MCTSKGSLPGIHYFNLTSSRHGPWLRALGRNPETEHLCSSNRVCSLHFAEEDIIVVNQRARLRAGAVPMRRARLRGGDVPLKRLDNSRPLALAGDVRARFKEQVNNDQDFETSMPIVPEVVYLKSEDEQQLITDIKTEKFETGCWEKEESFDHKDINFEEVYIKKEIDDSEDVAQQINPEQNSESSESIKPEEISAKSENEQSRSKKETKRATSV